MSRDSLPEDLRQDIVSLRIQIDALLTHDLSAPVRHLLETALEDLAHGEFLFEPAVLRAALHVPAAKVWRVAKTLELYGEQAQQVPEDLSDFDVLPGIRIRPAPS